MRRITWLQTFRRNYIIAFVQSIPNSTKLAFQAFVIIIVMSKSWKYLRAMPHRNDICYNLSTNRWPSGNYVTNNVSVVSRCHIPTSIPVSPSPSARPTVRTQFSNGLITDDRSFCRRLFVCSSPLVKTTRQKQYFYSHHHRAFVKTNKKKKQNFHASHAGL